jgi:protein-disulfide isomerase
MNRVSWIVTILLVIIIGGSIGAAVQNKKKNAVDYSVRVTPEDQVYAARLERGGWLMGNGSGPQQFIEYADPQCPACKALEGVLPEALEQANKETYGYTYRHMLINEIHRNAMTSALAMEAAGRQGKFWEMKEKVYAEQSNWESLSKAELRATMIEYASGTGINIEQFERDLDDPATKRGIDQDDTAAKAAGLRKSTPTVILNGTVREEFPRDVATWVTFLNTGSY